MPTPLTLFRVIAKDTLGNDLIAVYPTEAMGDGAPPPDGGGDGGDGPVGETTPFVVFRTDLGSTEEITVGDASQIDINVMWELLDKDWNIVETGMFTPYDPETESVKAIVTKPVSEPLRLGYTDKGGIKSLVALL